jgi:hypothetical protein
MTQTSKSNLTPAARVHFGRARRLQRYLALLALAGMTACVSTRPASVVPCKMAIVNPVSGNAECVEPRGADVDAPPPRPLPTEKTCGKHGDLELDECRSKSPQESGPN